MGRPPPPPAASQPCALQTPLFLLPAVSWLTDPHRDRIYIRIEPDEVGQMPLHPAIVREPPPSRRLRRWAPLLVLLGMLAATLVPGLIAADRPFEASLCNDLERSPDACAALVHTVLATMPTGGARPILPQ